MEKAEFKKQVKNLIKTADVDYMIDKSIDKLMNSGAIDLSSLNKDDFSTAKAVLSVIYENLSYNFQPLTPEGKKERDNLSLII